MNNRLAELAERYFENPSTVSMAQADRLAVAVELFCKETLLDEDKVADAVSLVLQNSCLSPDDLASALMRPEPLALILFAMLRGDWR